MTAVKYECQVLFPSGKVYLLYDEDWGHEILAEDEPGGNLSTIASWDEFPTREIWDQWGDVLENLLNTCASSIKEGLITEEEAFDQIWDFCDQYDTNAKVIEYLDAVS